MFRCSLISVAEFASKFEIIKKSDFFKKIRGILIKFGKTSNINGFYDDDATSSYKTKVIKDL